MRSLSKGFAATIAVIGVVLLPLPNLLPTISASENVIIREGDIEPEDYYAAAGNVIVEGVIQGDLVAVAGNLTITGRVEGDVTAIVWGSARIDGEVTGSVRIAARSLTVDATVGDDLFGAALFGTIRGSIERDVIMAGLDVTASGEVGRDLRGQFWQISLEGTIERNVDIAVQGLEVGAGASIGGDLSYRASDPGRISAGAVVEGQLIERDAKVPLALKAIQRLVSVLSVLAFVVAGIVSIWLFRHIAPRAITAVWAKPVRTGLVGLGALVAAPLAAIPLALTLVGIPLSGVLVILFLLSLFFGPIPAVAAVGDKLGRGRFGLMGAFVVGALIWRLGIWLIPFVGALLYFAALIWGVGGWVVGAWESRRSVVEEATPEIVDEDWEAPLPPE